MFTIFFTDTFSTVINYFDNRRSSLGAIKGNVYSRDPSTTYISDMTYNLSLNTVYILDTAWSVGGVIMVSVSVPLECSIHGRSSEKRDIIIIKLVFLLIRFFVSI